MNRMVHTVPFRDGIHEGNLPDGLRRGADIAFVIDIENMLYDGKIMWMSSSGMLLSEYTIDPKYFVKAYVIATGRVLYKARLPVAFDDQVETIEYHKSPEESGAPTSGRKAHIKIIRCEYCGKKEFSGSVICFSCCQNIGGDKSVDLQVISQRIAVESGRAVEIEQSRVHKRGSKKWWEMDETSFAAYARKLVKRSRWVNGVWYHSLMDRYERDHWFRQNMNNEWIYEDEINKLMEAALAPVSHTHRQRWQIDLHRKKKYYVGTDSGLIEPMQYDGERAEQMYREQSEQNTQQQQGTGASSSSSGNPGAPQAPQSWGSDEWWSEKWWESAPKRAKKWEWTPDTGGASSSSSRWY